MSSIDLVKKIYSIETVAIQNRVTECFKSMSVDEKRILIMASPIARTMDASEQDSILIRADDFAKECGIKQNSSYKQLQTAAERLVNRTFTYKNDRDKKVHSNWVIDATYEDAGVSLRFTGIILVMLKILDKYNPYTKYKKATVLSLKRDYSIDFYHLAKKYQKMGEFKLSLDDIFSEIGLSESYRDLSNLKRRVLVPSIEEINEKTDIEVKYFPIKKSRAVVGYTFTVKAKSVEEKPKKPTNRDQNTLDMFCQMSDSQIKMYSSVLSKSQSISELAGTMDYKTFELWIANILRDPESVRPETAKRIFKALRTETDFKG